MPRSIVAAAAIALVAVTVPVAGAERPPSIALVVQKAAAPDVVASDLAIIQHLEQRGYRVVPLDQADDAQAARDTDAVFISASVSSNKLGGKYRAWPKPVVTSEPYELPHLGMAGRLENGDYGTAERERWMWSVNASHPAAGGVASGLVNVQQKNVPMGWGKPGLGAIVLGTLPGHNDRAIAFVYEQGATMDYDAIAPARRAFLFVDNAVFPQLNADGLKVFDGVVDWAVRHK